MHRSGAVSVDGLADLLSWSQIDCEPEHSAFLKRCLRVSLLDPVLDSGDMPVRVQVRWLVRLHNGR